MPHEIENAKRQGKYENIRIKGKTAEYKSLPGSSSQTPPNPLTLTATSGSTVDQHHYHSSSIYCDPRRTVFSYNNLSYPSPPSYHSRPSTVSSSVLPWQTQDTGDPQAHAYSISSNPHTHSAQCIRINIRIRICIKICINICIHMYMNIHIHIQMCIIVCNILFHHSNLLLQDMIIPIFIILPQYRCL